MKNRICLLIVGLCLTASTFAQSVSGVWDVSQLGAKGDGKTMDTRAIQAAIDQCHRAGGGKVYLHNGTFLSGTLYLKSNVRLYIEAGATLLGSPQASDYPNAASLYPTHATDTVTSKAFIYAENVDNIAIEGRGVIDGRGDLIDQRKPGQPNRLPTFMFRPRIIHIRGSSQVRIKDITLRNSATWVQTYQQCTDLIIDGVTVDSRENKDVEQKNREYAVKHRNTDGLDLVDCEKVRVSNCFITSGDDAICLKSFSPDKACRDITITNCIVSAGASGIKIGTETAGTFEDITIQNCVVFDTWGDGIALMTADGGGIARVTISGISLRNIKRAGIFIRLNTRNRTYGNNTVVNRPYLKDLLLENIQGTRLSALGCSITGIEEFPVEDIVLRNLNLVFEGGGTPQDLTVELPEKKDAYPSPTMFGPELPAYGFYLRHARNITLDRVQLRFTQEDRRPALVCDDVQGLEIANLKAQSTPGTSALIHLANCQQTTISNAVHAGIPFLSVAGSKAGEVRLLNNQLGKAAQNYVLEKPSHKSLIGENK